MPIKVIYEPIYRTRVHFIFDVPKEKAFAYIKKWFIPLGILDKWGEKSAGMMYDDDGVNYFIVICAKKNYYNFATIIAHEALHVTARVMRRKGVVMSRESEEAFTYFQSWIMEELIDIYNHHHKTKRLK